MKVKVKGQIIIHQSQAACDQFHLMIIMKMGGKFPAKVIVLLDTLIMTHELFRRSGVQEPHPLRGRHGGWGSLPKKRVFTNFENSFRKFLKCVDCRPLLGRQQHAHLKISETTTRHHEAPSGSVGKRAGPLQLPAGTFRQGLGRRRRRREGGSD